MSSDSKINEFVNNALKELDLALSESFNSGKNYALGKLGKSVGLLREFQETIYERNPDLRPAPLWDGEEQPSLTNDDLG